MDSGHAPAASGPTLKPHTDGADPIHAGQGNDSGWPSGAQDTSWHTARHYAAHGQAWRATAGRAGQRPDQCAWQPQRACISGSTGVCKAELACHAAARRQQAIVLCIDVYWAPVRPTPAELSLLLCACALRSHAPRRFMCASTYLNSWAVMSGSWWNSSRSYRARHALGHSASER